MVAADELDERTLAFCQRVALNPLDALTVHKHVTNRWLEVMGLRLAALEGAEYDAIFHLTPAIGRVRPAQPGGRPAGGAGVAGRPVLDRDRRPTTTPPSGGTR